MGALASYHPNIQKALHAAPFFIGIISLFTIANLLSNTADAVTNQTVAASNTVASITNPVPVRPSGGFGGGDNAATEQDHKKMLELFGNHLPSART
ncbi:MAG: hypothetical protein WDM76_01425 [Limisphaerales bacterium]